jgi:hypothetical protein
MKIIRYLLSVAFLALLALPGCSADSEHDRPEDSLPFELMDEIGAVPGEDEEPIEGEMVVISSFPDGDELGTAHQPIFLPFGYGSEQNATQCDGSWSGGVCYVPDKRRLRVNLRISTCNSTFDVYLAEAYVKWRNFLQATGWTLAVSYDGFPGLGDAIPVEFKCVGGTGHSALASTLTPVGALDVDCHDAAPGDVCQYKSAKIEIYHNMIGAVPAWNPASDAKRSNFARNIIQHEGFHAAGLGHNSATPGSQLMATGGAQSQDPASNYWNLFLSPNNAERDQLACYNPNSGTQPDDNPACPL